MMQRLEGDFAGYYNRRKGRSGSFRDERYHCAMVEDGVHLCNCMAYVDLNMVRAGVVAHPAHWRWCGYRELIGERSRYRFLDLDLVVALMNWGDLSQFQERYRQKIKQALERRCLHREAQWTESIGVGSEDFVRRIAASVGIRHRRVRVSRGRDGSPRRRGRA